VTYSHWCPLFLKTFLPFGAIYILGNTKKSGGVKVWKARNRLLCSQHFWYRQRCVSTRSVAMEVPHSCSPHFCSFSSYRIIHTTQNFQTMSLSDRLVHWNELMMNNAARIEKRKDQPFFFNFRSHLSRFFFSLAWWIRTLPQDHCRFVSALYLQANVFASGVKFFSRHFVAGDLCRLKCGEFFDLKSNTFRRDQMHP
jgi:hypothetical protein